MPEVAQRHSEQSLSWNDNRPILAIYQEPKLLGIWQSKEVLLL